MYGDVEVCGGGICEGVRCVWRRGGGVCEGRLRCVCAEEFRDVEVELWSMRQWRYGSAQTCVVCETNGRTGWGMRGTKCKAEGYVHKRKTNKERREEN